ncbi:hypothetical protein ACFXKW_02035 [Streptomyces sp. NPDC059193]|uniref:hypothetical protein n=1 Tax=Streptomyces sp. NPDC059193 TaxID=3346763 RepID=UPI0036B9F367
MRRGVAGRLALVVPGGDDRAVGAEHDGADRHVAGRHRPGGLPERQAHGVPPRVPYGIGAVLVVRVVPVVRVVLVVLVMRREH